MSLFENAEVEIPCPNCGHKTAQKVGWLKHNTQFTCGGCGRAIEVDSRKLHAGLDSAAKSIDEFRRRLR